MDLQTFQAATMKEALTQVKFTMGADALILHTRTFFRRKWLGLRRREVVEITASRRLRERESARRPAASPPARRNVAAQVVGAAAYGGTTLAPSRMSMDVPERRSAEPGKAFLEMPVAQNVMMLGFSKEITALRSVVEDLVMEQRHRQCPQVPEDLFVFYMQLIENQVAVDLATDLIKTLQKQIRPEHVNQPEFVRQKLAEHIEKMLPAAGPIVRTKSVGPHVVALIGPTGVGKTTTVAKLAANLKLRERHRVGLITIDTYRIAAIDQLKKYADIIGSPLRVVGSPEDMKEAVASMRDFDFILIDTAGRSPTDTLKLNELKQFLEAATPDEVHLVLSTTSSQDCVELAINRFADVRVDKIIFTKLDEAAHVGVVLNVVKKVGKGLSYVTTGQDVPDDIEVGRGRKLAQLILGGAQ